MKLVLQLLVIITFITHSTLAQSPNWQWINETGSRCEEITALPNGDLLITGNFENTIVLGADTLTSKGEGDVFVARIDSNGNYLWTFSIGGPKEDYANSITYASTGSFYAMGHFDSLAYIGGDTLYENGQVRGIYIAKFDLAGNLIWSTSFDGTSSSPIIENRNIAIGRDGELYIAGSFSDTVVFTIDTLIPGNLSRDFFLAKFDSNGIYLWSRQYVATGQVSNHASGPVLDSLDNIYITGSFREGEAYFGSDTLVNPYTWENDIFITKFDSSGTVIWAKHIKPVSSFGLRYSQGHDLAIDEAGYLFITGIFSGEVIFGSDTLNGYNSEWDIFLAKYDLDGNCRWAVEAGGAFPDFGWAIDIDEQSNCYLSGAVEGTAYFGSDSVISYGGNDLFVAKYDSSGLFQWVKSAGGTTDNDFAADIAVTSSGSIYAGGIVSNDAYFDCFSFSDTTIRGYLAKLSFQSINVSLIDTVITDGSTRFCNGDSVKVSVLSDPLVAYQWQKNGLDLTGYTNSSLNIDSSGEYTVIVTHPGGCIDTSESVTVTVDTIPTVSMVGLDATYCLNDLNDTLIGVPGGGIFSGSGMIGNIFTPSIAGIGTININYVFIDGNGCTDSSYNSAIVYSLPNANAGNDISICNGDSTVLTATGGLAYFWNIGDTTSSITTSPLDTNSFYVEVSDGNGCKSYDTVTVFVKPLPVVSLLNLDSSYCYNDSSIALNGNPFGGTFSGVGVIGNTFVPNQAGIGTHVLVYTYMDTNLCMNSDSQTVTVHAIPTVSFTGLDTSYCQNGPISDLTGTPPGGLYNGPGITSDNFDPINAGTGIHLIIYAYTDSNGCADTDSQSVEVHPDPIATIITSDTTAFCDGESIILKTSSGTNYTYQWQKDSIDILNANDSMITSTTTGSYQVIVSNEYSCIDTSELVPITVFPLPKVSFTGLDSNYCLEDDTILLSGNPVGGVFSGNGITDSMFNAVIADTGIHSIMYIYIDTNGCSNDTTQVVTVHSEPKPQITVQGDTLLSSKALSYQWLLNGDSVQGAKDQVLIASSSGNYSVAVFDSNGCDGISEAVFVTIPTNGFLRQMNFNFSIFPNPTFGQIWVNIDGYIRKIIQIQDLLGRTLVEKEFEPSKNHNLIHFDISHYPTGIYFIGIQNGSDRIIQKIIKQ